MPQFTKLDINEQKNIISQSSLNLKAELILDSHEPEQLMSTLSDDEMFLIYKKSDTENLPDILRCLEPDQLLFISDLECWEKDTFNPQKLISWLENLWEADVETLTDWLLNADLEILVLGLSCHIHVFKYLSKEDAIETVLPNDKPYFSLDNFYYICIAEETNFELIRKILEIIYSENKDIYLNILEGILNEYNFEVMENAYTSRMDRLTFKGFPEPSDALKIYLPLTKEQLFRQEQKETRSLESSLDLDDKPVLDYPALWTEEKLFFDDVWLHLKDLGKEVYDHIQLELSWMSHKVIVINGIESFSEETAHTSFNQVKNYLNIALETLAQNNIQEALKIIQTFWLEDIFRFGFTLLLKLRKEAEQITQIYKSFANALVPFTEQFYYFITDEHALLFKSLLHKHPKKYNEATQSETLFKKTAEIVETKTKVQQIQSLFNFLKSPLFTNFTDFFPKKEHFSETSHITITSLVLTIFANYTVYKTIQIKPLTIDELLTFLNKAIQSKQLNNILLNNFLKEIEQQQNNVSGLVNTLISDSLKELIRLKKNPQSEISHSNFILTGN